METTTRKLQVEEIREGEEKKMTEYFCRMREDRDDGGLVLYLTNLSSAWRASITPSCKPPALAADSETTFLDNIRRSFLHSDQDRSWLYRLDPRERRLNLLRVSNVNVSMQMVYADVSLESIDSRSRVSLIRTMMSELIEDLRRTRAQSDDTNARLARLRKRDKDQRESSEELEAAYAEVKKTMLEKSALLLNEKRQEIERLREENTDLIQERQVAEGRIKVLESEVSELRRRPVVPRKGAVVGDERSASDEEREGMAVARDAETDDDEKTEEDTENDTADEDDDEDIEDPLEPADLGSLQRDAPSSTSKSISTFSSSGRASLDPSLHLDKVIRDIDSERAGRAAAQVDSRKEPPKVEKEVSKSGREASQRREPFSVTSLTQSEESGRRRDILRASSEGSLSGDLDFADVAAPAVQISFKSRGRQRAKRTIEDASLDDSDEESASASSQRQRVG